MRCVFTELSNSGLMLCSEPVFELDATKDPATIRAQLAQTYPETLALAREWEDNLIALDKAEKAVQQYVEYHT